MRVRVVLTTILLPMALALALSLAAVAVARGGSGDGDTKRDSAGAKKAPNVLVVMTDDQDAASLEAMPQVQRLLVDNGTNFTNALVNLPQCCPSRATFLSGQYAHNHGVLENAPPDGGYSAFNGKNSLPVWLEKAGYRTGWIGKYLNGYGNPEQGTDPNEIPPGWTDWVAPVFHTEYQMYGYTLNNGGDLKEYGSKPGDYETDVLAGHARDVIRDSASDRDPFFLTVVPLAPHHEGGELDDRPGAERNPRPAPRHLGRFDDLPLPRPPSFNEPDDSDKVTQQPALGSRAKGQLTKTYRSRMESLLAVDDMVASLVGELERTGQLDDTLIIFTSDQGFMLGEHRLVGKNRLYEEAVHVPLVMRGPGIASGKTEPALVGNVDLAPTIVDATGANAGLKMDGMSLLPLADDPKPAESRPLLLELLHGGDYSGVRTDKYAYLDFGKRGTELYDMTEDPFQLKNRSGEPDFKSVEAKLEALLKRLEACRGKSCR